MIESRVPMDVGKERSTRARGVSQHCQSPFVAPWVADPGCRCCPCPHDPKPTGTNGSIVRRLPRLSHWFRHPILGFGADRRCSGSAEIKGQFEAESVNSAVCDSSTWRQAPTGQENEMRDNLHTGFSERSLWTQRGRCQSAFGAVMRPSAILWLLDCCRRVGVVGPSRDACD